MTLCYKQGITTQNLQTQTNRSTDTSIRPLCAKNN